MENLKFLLTDGEFTYALFKELDLAKKYKEQQEEELDLNGLDIPEWEIKEIDNPYDYIPKGHMVEAYYKDGNVLSDECLAVCPKEDNCYIDFGFLCHIALGLEEGDEDLTTFTWMR